VTAEREHRREAKAVSAFKFVAALIIAPALLIVIVVALVTVVLWLVLGTMMLLVGVAEGITKKDGGRRLRSTGLHLLRSGPSRWLVKAAMHRARRAWSRQGSSRKT
jgi:fatty acid desaturase